MPILFDFMLGPAALWRSGVIAGGGATIGAIIEAIWRAGRCKDSANDANSGASTVEV